MATAKKSKKRGAPKKRPQHPLPGVTYGPGYRPTRRKPRTLRRVRLGQHVAGPDKEVVAQIIAAVRERMPKSTEEDVRAWLFGEHLLSEDDKVLAAAARRAAKQHVAAAHLAWCIWSGVDLSRTKIAWGEPAVQWRAS